MKISGSTERSGFAGLLDRGSELRGSCVAILGAGGKTALLYQLGAELARVYPRVLLTSITQSEFPAHLNVYLLSDKLEGEMPSLFGRDNPVFLMNTRVSSLKLEGLSVKQLHEVRRHADVCLFECDGARGRSLKVHNERDPEVPAFSTHVIIVVGADVVGTTLVERMVHRPDAFRQHWNIDNHESLDAAFVTRVVTSQQGYLSKIPQGIKPVYYVNKFDTHAREAELLGCKIRATGAAVFTGSTRAGTCHSVN